MKSNKILVTGGAGFIGSNLCQKLIDQGENVVCVDNFDSYYDPKIKRDNISNLISYKKFKIFKTDVRDAKSINKIFKSENPDFVIHLAALAGVRTSINKAQEYVDVNVNGTINILNASRDHKIKNIVIASTSSVYGSALKVPFTEEMDTSFPLAPYPMSKKAAELISYTYHHLFNMNITCLRFFTAYGPRVRPDMMSFMVMDKIVKGEEITVFDNKLLKRDWTYIDDVCDGIIASSKKTFGYEIINIGNSRPVFVIDFIKTVENIVGKKVKIKIVKTPKSEPTVTFANIKKAKKLLNYYPKTNLSEGLQKTWEWFREYKKL